MSFYANYPATAGVLTLNSLAGALTLVAGSNITITPSGNNLTIAASGGGGGGVTEVDTGVGLTGGPITSTGTINLADTAVTPGTYSSADITVDQQGRITAASDGAGSGANQGLSNLANVAINEDLIFVTGADATIQTQNDLSAATKALTLKSGNGTGQDSGAVYLKSGDTDVGTSGDVNVATGTSGGTRGKIKFVDGSEGTAGQVWTSTGTQGEGAWTAAGTGANTALSNLSSVAINADLLPGTSGVPALGSFAKKFSALHMQGTASIYGDNSIRIYNSANDTYIGLQAPAPFTGGSYSIRFPGAQGAVGTTLVNDGSGTLSWAGGYTKYTKTFSDFSDPGTSKTIVVASIPAGMFVEAQIIHHTVAFTGGGNATATVDVLVGGVSPTGPIDVFVAPIDNADAVSASAVNDINFNSAQDLSFTLAVDVSIATLTGGSVDVYVKYSKLP